MGWMLVLFDLPVAEPQERRIASRFRNNLLDGGYLMLQKSVYARSCVSVEKYDQYLNRLKVIAPEKGSVTVIYITDKQWLNAVNLTLIKPERAKFEIDAGEEQPKQMTFW